ncbi:autotransporter-associated beta strand protein, partial [Paraburkholderia silvatlantica]
ATTISGGTLALGGTGSIASSSGVIDNGTFDISGTTNGAAIANLSGTGVATLGAKTLTLTAASGTFDGTIGGTGTLVRQGSGTWTLTGANSYSGATTISGGTLALGGAGSIASSSGVIDNGTFDISGTTNGAAIANLSGTGIATLGAKTLTLTAASGTFDGTIGGTGALVRQGSGTWTLTGANSYSGATTISGGTLALGGAGSIASSSGVIDNGTFDISGTANGAAIANLSGTGIAALGAKTLTLTAANGTFSGTIAGTGTLVKQGSGLLTLDGNSAAFAGNTTVSGGALEVGDADSPTAALGGNVNVAAAGTLRGHGTVLGDVVNGGTVAPGGSIGTLSVGGNYAQASNATLAIEVSPSGASALNVGGSATLNGVLAITYGPGTYAAKSYTLVSAAKGISGTFGSVTSAKVSYLGTLTPSVAYGANEVELTLAAAAPPPSDPVTPSAPVVVAPVDTSIYAAVGTSTILGAQAQGAALLERLGSGWAAASATPRGWITATGSHTNVGGTNGEPGFQSNRYGFLAGLERKYGEYDAGVAVGYDHADIDEAVTTDLGTTDTLRAALYGRRRVGPVDLGATLGAGLDFLSQKRPFGPLGTAEGDHMGQEFNVGGQASLPMTFGDVRITPRVGLRYAYFHANGFDESGAGGQDLVVGTDNVRSLQPYVAVTVDKAFGDALRPVNAELRIGYAHELLDANRTLSVTSLDGTVFAAPGTSLPRGYLSAGASVTLHPAKHLDVSLGYDAVINTTHVSAQQGSLQVGYRF